MLEDEDFYTVSGEQITVSEGGTAHIQMIILGVYNAEYCQTEITARLLPQEARVLAEKLNRFAEFADKQQPHG